MAPSKARIWAKMAENRGEIAQRIQKLNGFSDQLIGGKNRPGAHPADARAEHVESSTAEPVKTVAHCCPQKIRRDTRRAGQSRSVWPLRSAAHVYARRSRYHGGSSGAVLPPGQLLAVTVRHFTMVMFQPTPAGSCALPGSGREAMRRDERDPGGMREERAGISRAGSRAVLISCRLARLGLLNFIMLSRQDQTGTNEVDGMERGDAADGMEVQEVDDPSSKVLMTDPLRCILISGLKRPREPSKFTWKTGLKKKIQEFVTGTWNQGPAIGLRSQTMRSQMRMSARLASRQTTMSM